jgi:hypothetical protein
MSALGLHRRFVDDLNLLLQGDLGLPGLRDGLERLGCVVQKGENRILDGGRYRAKD